MIGGIIGYCAVIAFPWLALPISDLLAARKRRKLAGKKPDIPWQ